MNKKKIKGIFILFNLLVLLYFVNSFYFTLFQYSPNQITTDSEYRDPLTSNAYTEDIIVFFNDSSYDNSIISRFEYYGGVVKDQWNNLFSSFSGFSGIMVSEQNKTLFHNEVPDSNIENNEILKTQMSFASIQTGASNSSWFLDGFKGETNCSVAVLDTGINPNHKFFPQGYNPTDLTGNIVGWENFVDSSPISDDNGHGTFISSVISGTGTDSFEANNPVIVTISKNYSHIELFNEFSPAKNYSLKLFSFNSSKQNSNIIINSSWNWEIGGIDGFWVELFYNNTLVGSSHNSITNQNYIINYTVPINGLGIYDLYIKYHKQLQSKPVFSINSTVNYFPEYYIANSTYFTGVANATKIVAYKVLNQSGIGYSSDLISALSNVINNRISSHIVSVCLSIGTLGEEVEAIHKAIDEVIEKGILVVIAVGNSGIEISNSLNRLAENENAIVVGAINDKDQVTSYSSMGKDTGYVLKPDIVAPGGSKLSTHRTIISADEESDKITSTYGTSIATAIVSGAINLLIEAKWNNWINWNSLNTSQWVKHLKAILLMTASETNLEREDDPFTIEDESEYSPAISTAPLTTGLKDIHEGYGRINIQAAIDALTKSIEVDDVINESLRSSREDPLGNHVFSRRIELIEDKQYLFNLSIAESDSDFDMYLFSNVSNHIGEPILLESSRRWFSDNDYFYFTPMENQTNCIITIKAIEGKGSFSLNISEVENLYEPALDIPEINYIGGSKNTTIMSLQEFTGNEPARNYSIDSFQFYIEYFDKDTSNVPPQEVYVSILGISKNYTMTQLFPLDANYSDGALFVSQFIQFPEAGLFQYFFIASDGFYRTRYPEVGFLNITIEFPTDSVQFPSQYSFNDGFGNWSYTGMGWDVLQQSNNIDNRSTLYQNTWNSIYFGTYHNFPENYTYQPIRVTEDPYPNGSLISPLFNLTHLNVNNTQPFARFGLRISINTGDFIYLQINLNYTGWITLRTYTNEERDWFLEEVNLSEYIGNFIQFRFDTSIDDTYDPINYKGFILDYFSMENYSNNYSPQIEFNISKNIPITQESKYYQFKFSCNYFDLDNNYPTFVFLEIGSTNYTMYNYYGDWNASSYIPGDYGILFSRRVNLEGISNRSFRFHALDGNYLNTTKWYNEDNSLFQFIEPEPLGFNVYQDQKYIGYVFSNTNLNDYYITGNPLPKEPNSWLRGDNTWHPFVRLEKEMIYGGIGQSFGGTSQGYGIEWDTNLITKPLMIQGEYNVYLEFGYDISLQNEFFQPDDQLDKCTVSISKDFGVSWKILKEYTYTDETLSGIEKIDISQYRDETVMIKFTLNSNDIVFGLGYGWLLYDVYIGYDKTTDFIAPKVNILNPQNDSIVKSKIKITANVSDNLEIDETKITIFLNDNSVSSKNIRFNSTSNTVQFLWNSINYNDGRYEIKIIVYDKAGNSAEDLVIVQVNNVKWWITWGPYIVLILSIVIIGFSISFYKKRKDTLWFSKLRESRAEKIRLGDLDKDQAIKRIEIIDKKEELRRPLTLYCKFCRSWFFAEDFDIMCPNCDHDQIYSAYFCSNCGKRYLKDEPSENYYCKNKTCEGVRLIRKEKDEIQNFLAQKGIVLRKFEKKKRKFSILDND
ncbi:MAG: S8 family serine peptidase [Promethearchaeota archaeon]